ncbi:MAG TPA: hypothetical protein VLD67_21275 [Vicinamibacterales bacterium]|nr:hypothetical protein [Vicinamibacterales bacterium]
MDPDVQTAGLLAPPKIDRRECGHAEFGDDGRPLRNRRAQERDRDRVSRRIAPLDTSDAVITMRCRQVVLVRGRPVVMLGMIVIRVGVRVQR